MGANLRLDWCSHEAAKYAVEHWHYSRTMPMPPLLRVGVWESEKYIGCVLFGRGNTPTLGNSYGLEMTEVCELVRVALTKHVEPVSRIVAVAIRLLKQSNPKLRLIVSFADPSQGHNGAIYQAGNWIYTGRSTPSPQWLHNGKWKHHREVSSGAFGNDRKVIEYTKLPKREGVGKYRYLMPLDDEMRERIKPLAKPYPKKLGTNRATAETETGAASSRDTGGANPTVALRVE